MRPTELRPVEALWLLDEEREQPWTRENALRAALVSLSMRGLLEPEADEEGFEPTDVERPDDLREYEQRLLDAIVGEDDERAMVGAVYDFNYREFFADRGLYEEDSVDRSLLFGLISWTDTKWARTVEYQKCINHLASLRYDLADAVEREEVRPDRMPMVYAYPDADFYEEFSERAEELTVDLPTDADMAQRTTAASAGIAPAIAASSAASAASCAAASSATAASACSAAGASAGAGAAGGGAI